MTHISGQEQGLMSDKIPGRDLRARSAKLISYPIDFLIAGGPS